MQGEGEKGALSAEDLALVTDTITADGDGDAGGDDNSAGDSGASGKGAADAAGAATRAEGDGGAIAADKAAAGKGPKAAAADSVLGGEGDAEDEGDEAGEKDASGQDAKDKDADDKDGKDKPDPATAGDWASLRGKAIDAHITKITTALAKKLTAEELPKEIAKRRAALEKHMARYGSVENALIAGFEAAEKVRSGAHKQALPEDATDSEKAEWRKANNIPDKAEAYEVPAVAGHQWTEADKPALDRLKGIAFEKNWSQEVVSGVTALYAGLVEDAKQAQTDAMLERDQAGVEARRERRRELWPGEHKAALSIMERGFKNAPNTEGDVMFRDGTLPQAIASARLPDGTRIIDHPGFEEWWYGVTLNHYGAASLISGDAQREMSNREEELVKLMNTNIAEFRRGKSADGKSFSEELQEIRRKKAGRGR